MTLPPAHGLQLPLDLPAEFEPAEIHLPGPRCPRPSHLKILQQEEKPLEMVRVRMGIDHIIDRLSLFFPKIGGDDLSPGSKLPSGVPPPSMTITFPGAVESPQRRPGHVQEGHFKLLAVLMEKYP